MLELVFIRHGETEGSKRKAFVGRTDLELTEAGRAQAHTIKEKMARVIPDAVFSSPFKRTFQTAEIIHKAFGLPVQTVDSLKERDFGLWDNLTLDEIKSKYPAEAERWLTDPTSLIPGGENLIQFRQRVISFLDGLIPDYPKGRILLVTHGGCIRTMITHLLGFKPEECWRFKIDTGSIAKVEVDECGYAYLTLLNG